MTQHKRTVIDKSTLIPVSLLGAIIGCAVWMTMLYATANQNSIKISAIQAQNKLKANDVSQIKTDIAVIKTILKIKEENNHE